MAPIKNINRINAGFIGIFIILGCMMFFWLLTIHKNNQLLEYMMNENQEAILIHDLVHAMHNRTIALYHMSTTNDAFEADEQMLRFMSLAEKFIKTRDKVLASSFSKEEKDIWLDVIPDIRKAQQASREVLDLIYRGEQEKAQQVLKEQVRTNQEQVVHKLNHIIQYQNTSITEDFFNYTQQNKLAYPFTAGFTVLLIIIAIMVFITLQKKQSAEDELIRQGERIRALYEISSLSGMSNEQQLRETLNFGRSLLGTEIAKVSKIDQEAATNTVAYIEGPEEIMKRMSPVQPLDQTICNIVYSTEKPLTISHASHSSYKDHHGILAAGVETYAAVPIWVNDKKYGTVCFANREKRDVPFSETELDLIQLIGRWVSVTIEREINQTLALEKKEAVAANKAKGDFLAIMSHEIRTPLNAIIGFAEASLHLPTDREELDESLHTIVRSGHHLLQLINNTLDLSKIESGNMQVETLKTSLPGIIEDVEILNRPHAEEKGLTLLVEYEYPIPEFIQTDPVKLKQILINLLGNAIKFTESGSVKLTVQYHAKSGELAIAVIDSGIGLSEEQQDVIFNPFTQADLSTTRKYGGTGLGLSLSRQLASLLGGALTVKSELGLGSRFELKFNAGELAEKALIYEQINKKQDENSSVEYKTEFNGSARILVVDDNDDNQRLLGILLRQPGIKLSYANNGEHALSMVAANESGYDLILMDMQMPVMDGYTAVSTLRDKGYDKPIIALTADVLLENQERCLSSGCDDVMSKPVNREYLYDVLQRYITVDSANRGTFLTSLLEDDPEFAQIVHAFVKRLPGEIDKIRAAISVRDWDTLKFVLHDIKGVSGNLGYTNISKTAENIEQAVQQEKYNMLDEMFVLLEKYIQELTGDVDI